MAARSPSQLYALLVGLGLVAGGVLGFFYNASFATGDDLEREAVLGILDVNAWHNIVHITTGAVALLFVGTYSASRAFALVFGAIYLLVALIGFIVGDGEAILDAGPRQHRGQRPAPADRPGRPVRLRHHAGHAGADDGRARGLAAQAPAQVLRHAAGLAPQRAQAALPACAAGGPAPPPARPAAVPPTTTAAAGRYQLRGSRMEDSSQSASSSAAASVSSVRRCSRRSRHGARGLDGNQRAAQQALYVAHLSHRLPCSRARPRAGVIARWINTFVAPSERPRARAISRLSMSSAKRMISASRRSSGRFATPASTSATSSRPSTRSSVAWGEE